MDLLDRRIREYLRQTGISVHIGDSSLHLDGLVVGERLAGVVDGVNRSFWLTYLPVPGTLMVFFRRGLLEEGNAAAGGDMEAEARGRNVLLNEPPLIYGDQIDRAPRAIYKRRYDVPDVTFENTPALFRRRRLTGRRRPMPPPNRCATLVALGLA